MDLLEGSIDSKRVRHKEKNWSTFLQGPVKAENLQCELIVSATNTAAPRSIQVFLLGLQQGCHLAILVVTSLHRFLRPDWIFPGTGTVPCLHFKSKDTHIMHNYYAKQT